MVGNIFLMLPLFETRWAMSLIAAAPFVLLTFLISPYSPYKIVSSTTASGHGLGLVYYSLSWTILAYVFFDSPEVIAVGIVAMSYGDGFASIVGTYLGKNTYSLWGESKTIEGSIGMFIVTLLVTSLALSYYEVFPSNIIKIFAVAGVATFIEGITPKGIDNLTVSLSASFIYYLGM